ncbi:MAG: DUF3035 domain-containing protein [Pseudomonadota bacterium]
MTTRFLQIFLVLALAACGGGDDTSLVERISANNQVSPDEFGVLPQKPLELPEDLSVLPPPTPGAGNRTDLTPRRDVLVALSGRDTKAAPTGADAALVSALSRGGVTPEIRQLLTAEDAEYRRNNRGLLLERLFDRDTEFLIYDRMLLDAGQESERLRRLGLRVPPIPPAE